MKRVLLITALAIVALASCKKEDKVAIPQESPKVSLALNIADKASYGDTKAVKEGWVDGDYIYLAFQPSDVTTVASFVKVIIQKSGESWNVVEGQSELNTITTGGKVSALYIAGSKRDFTYDSWNGGRHHFGIAGYYHRNNIYGEVQGIGYNGYGVDYTITDNVISASLEFYPIVTQITVTNIPNNVGWDLLTPNNANHTCLAGLSEVAFGIYASTVRCQTNDFILNTDPGLIHSVKNGEDIVFYASYTRKLDQEIQLTLKNVNTDMQYTKSFGEKRFADAHKAIKIVGPVLNEDGTIQTANGWAVVE